MDERTIALDALRANRRQLLRAAGIGLTLPFAAAALSACDLGEADDDDTASERGGALAGANATVTPPNYTGSDASHHGTGAASPEPAAEVAPFQVRDPFLQPATAGAKEIQVVAQDATLYVANGVGF